MSRVQNSAMDVVFCGQDAVVFYAEKTDYLFEERVIYGLSGFLLVRRVWCVIYLISNAYVSPCRQLSRRNRSESMEAPVRCRGARDERAKRVTVCHETAQAS